MIRDFNNEDSVVEICLEVSNCHECTFIAASGERVFGDEIK